LKKVIIVTKSCLLSTRYDLNYKTTISEIEIDRVTLLPISYTDRIVI